MRVQYCRWFRGFLAANGEHILDITLLSHEARFHLSRYVNSQNSRVWLAFNPHIMETPLYDEKAGV
jgi:hypothetical protein